MKIRIVPYKMSSKSARLLASKLTVKLGYKVWRGRPRYDTNNIFWGKPGHIAANKLKTFNVLKEAGVSHVPYTSSKEEAEAWLKAGSTVLARTACGQAGSGITIVNPGSVLPEATLYTRYVKKKKEFRVHVYQGKVIFVQEKRKANGVEADPLIRSHKRGWKFCMQNVVEPDGLRVLAVNAVGALGLDFGGVDVIWNELKNTCYVLEVNTAPGIEGSSLEAYANAISAQLS